MTNKVTKSNNYYGDAWRQIAVHHGDSLHAAGFRGKGMQIAVIDAGFIMLMRSVFSREWTCWEHAIL